MALVQAEDEAGRARRRELLEKAAALCAAESDEVRQISYWRELIRWIDEERTKHQANP